MKGCVSKYSTRGSSKPHWRYRIYRGKDTSGKKQFKIKAGFKKQGEAEDAMRIAMAEIDASGPCTQEDVGGMVADLVGNLRRRPLPAKDAGRYQQLTGYILDAPEGSVQLAGVDLAELSHTQIESALYGLLKLPGKRRAHISARTVRHVGGLLSVALNKDFRSRTGAGQHDVAGRTSGRTTGGSPEFHAGRDSRAAGDMPWRLDVRPR